MRSSSRAVRTSVLVALTAFATALTVAAPPSGASTLGTATLKLSGSAKGTLHEGSGGFCTVEMTATGIDIIGLTGHISGADKTATLWSFELSAAQPGGGTFKAGPPHNLATGQLDPVGQSSAQSGADVFNSTKKGSFTEHGDQGTVDMTFANHKKSVTVRGFWDC
jgi:hypothetical protein